MWWSNQNLDKPFKTKDGGLWHFRVWNDIVDGRYIQRIFFWDDAQMTTGCAEFAGDRALHLSKVRQRKLKLATDPGYRERFRQELKFPVERYHA